jgi:hypothetical protein
MPVHKRNIQERRAEDDRYRALKEQLIAEWRRDPQQPAPAGAPDIEEETDARDQVLHVVVTWDEWADLDAQTRSEIIVDAFQAVKEAPAIANLTLAMGVTTAEAGRLRGVARR